MFENIKNKGTMQIDEFYGLANGESNNEILNVQHRIINKGKKLDDFERNVYMDIVLCTENVFINICKDLDDLKPTLYRFSEMLISVSMKNIKALGMPENYVYCDDKVVSEILDIDSKFKRLKLLYSYGNESFKNCTPIFYKYLTFFAKQNGVKLEIEKDDYCSEDYLIKAYVKNLKKFESFMEVINKIDCSEYTDEGTVKVLEK